MSLDIRLFAAKTNRLPHQPFWLSAFQDGLWRHGIKAPLLSRREFAPCDVAVFWSARPWDLFEKQWAHGGHVLVLERGFVGDRTLWTHVGWDGLNRRADFKAQGMPADRWNRHFANKMQPWRSRPQGYDLVIGQVPGDASIRGRDYDGWLRRIGDALQDHDVRFRPHPVAPKHRVPDGMALCRAKTLDEAMAGARRVLTFNSNVGVDAVLAGVPTAVADEGAMAWPVAAHGFTHPPPQPDRTQWAADLAYCQWNEDDMRSGDCWAHIGPA